jgi:hypothetical protein
MPKLTPEELLRAIETSPTSAEEDPDNDGAPDPFDAAVAEVLAMTPEERRRELETAGIDVEKMHADTAALLGRAPAAPAEAAPVPPAPEAPREAPPTAPIPLPARVRNRPLLLLAAALAIVVAAAAAYRTYFAPRVDPSLQEEPPATAPARSSHAPSPPAPSSDPSLDVAALRREGLDACRAQRWQECKDRLDLADRHDPAGSRDPLVALARSQAALALRGAEGGADEGNENAKQPGSLPRPRTSAPE